MIFPSLGPIYLDEKYQHIKKRMETSYTDALTINQAYWSEADIDDRFYCGDQTVFSDFYAGSMPISKRKQFNFNRIRTIINSIEGYQRRNRKSMIVVPVENADSVTADQFTKVIMWAARQDQMLETISDAFHGACITGMNLLQLWLDFRTDPLSGNLRLDNCPYNSFIIDPYFKKTDLSDCNFIWKRTWVSRREAMSLLPQHEEEISQLPSYDSSRDGKFQFMPESYNYGSQNLLMYDEYYYRDYRKQLMLVDSVTGECTEWRNNDEDALRYFLSMYPQITTLKQEIPTVRQAIVVQGKVLYDGQNVLGVDSYPFVPVFSYYNSETPYFPNRVQGVVRGLRDAQFLYNRRKAIELDILESQVNSGFIYKPDSMINPADVFLTGQGRGIPLKPEAQMTDIQQIQSPAIPPTTIQLSEILAREINEISGVNQEMLGSAVDDKAGILSMLRQGAGLTTLQILFDRLDASQKQLGRLMIDVIQANFMPGKVQKIINEQPQPQFYNKAFGKYDAAVEDGLNTTTQQQMQFAQMLQLREAGVPITNEDLLEAATIQNKKKIIDNSVKQQQAQQQIQEQQMQAAMEEKKANIELVSARAAADRGLGLERVSRVQENTAQAEERRSEAEKNRESGFLSLVKAFKELDDLDINQIHRLVELSKLVKEEHSSSVQNGSPLMPNDLSQVSPPTMA